MKPFYWYAHVEKRNENQIAKAIYEVCIKGIERKGRLSNLRN